MQRFLHNSPPQILVALFAQKGHPIPHPARSQEPDEHNRSKWQFGSQGIIDHPGRILDSIARPAMSAIGSGGCFGDGDSIQQWAWLSRAIRESGGAVNVTSADAGAVRLSRIPARTLAAIKPPAFRE